MGSKVCNKCNTEKSLNEFGKDSKMKSGYKNDCKECRNSDNKIYRINNSEKIQKYFLENKEKIRVSQKKYYENNKEIILRNSKEYSKNYQRSDKRKKYEKEYRKKNKDKIRLYYINNGEKIKKYQKLYREKNSNNSKLYNKKYREENNEILKIKKYEYTNFRLKNDSLFRVKENLKTLIRNSFKYKVHKKNTKTEQILGCTFEEFKQYLESRFEFWMSWDIDHIIPVSSTKTEEEIIKLNHYTNLQPLCSYTNRYIKRNKTIY